MNEFYVTIWESVKDWSEGDDGIALVFPDCTKEEVNWFADFCKRHKKPITIAILPEGDEDGNR